MAIIAYKFYCYQNQKIICMAFISNYCHQSEATDIHIVVLLIVVTRTHDLHQLFQIYDSMIYKD